MEQAYLMKELFFLDNLYILGLYGNNNENAVLFLAIAMEKETQVNRVLVRVFWSLC